MSSYSFLLPQSCANSFAAIVLSIEIALFSAIWMRQWGAWLTVTATSFLINLWRFPRQPINVYNGRGKCGTNRDVTQLMAKWTCCHLTLYCSLYCINNKHKISRHLYIKRATKIDIPHGQHVPHCTVLVILSAFSGHNLIFSRSHLCDPLLTPITTVQSTSFYRSPTQHHPRVIMLTVSVPRTKSLDDHWSFTDAITSIFFLPFLIQLKSSWTNLRSRKSLSHSSQIRFSVSLVIKIVLVFATI